MGKDSRDGAANQPAPDLLKEEKSTDYWRASNPPPNIHVQMSEDYLSKFVQGYLGFRTGIPRVGISHTAPAPADTVPVTGKGTYRTVIGAVSNGFILNKLNYITLQKKTKVKSPILHPRIPIASCYHSAKKALY